MQALMGCRTEKWTVCERPRTVSIWTMDEWNGMANDQRPGDAMMIGGIGWVVVRPEGEGSADDVPFAAVAPDGLPSGFRPHPRGPEALTGVERG
jgi:hypothetical protein